MPPTSNARGFTIALAACVVGAGITLFAVTRTWSQTLTRRPAPLAPVMTGHAGTGHLGWVVAIALVGLAGAGALVATKAGVRTVVGVLLGLAGLAIVGGGIEGLTIAGGVRLAWPVIVMIGGLLIAYGGLRTTREGASWPAMGARYERPARSRSGPATEASMWDDLDRGVDPTARDGH